MAHVRLNEIQRLALGITLIYAVFASSWIILADPLIETAIADPAIVSRLNLIKSGIFVFATSVLLFWLTCREILSLKRVQERYRVLFEGSQDSLFVIDRQGKTLDANPAALKLTGYSRDELLRLRIAELLPAEHRERFGSALAEFSARQSAQYVAEHQLETLSGATIPIDMSVSPIQFAEQQAFLCIVRDITTRREAETALRQSEERFRTLIDAAPLGIMLSRSNTPVYANAAYCRMFGNTGLNEIEGLSFINQIAPAERERILDLVTQRGDSRGPFPAYETMGLRKDGSCFPIHVEVTEIDLPDGRAQLAFITDITERKRAEEMIIRSRDFQLSLFEDFPALIWRADSNGNCNYFNQTWLNFTGQTLEHAIVNWRDCIPPEDLARCRTIFEEAFAQRKPFETEYRLRRYDGEYRWMLDYGRPFVDLDGAYAGYIGAVYDITERKQVEEALQESEANLRAIFDNAYQSVVLIARDYRIKSFNRFANMAAVSLYGREMEVGRSILEYIPPQDKELFVDVFQKTLTGSTTIVERPTTTNGTEWWELYYNPLTTLSGEISGIAFTARNISERKRAEEALRKTEERLRTVIASAPIVLFAFDRDGVFTLSEGKALETLGFSAGELVGRSIFEVYRDHPSLLKHARRALAGEAYTTVIQINRLALEMRLAPVRDQDCCVSGVIVVAIDITDRQEAELLLRETEAREQAILNGTSDYVYLKDRQGCFLLVNPATAQLIGRDPDDLIGKNAIEMLMPDAADELNQTDQLVLSTGQTYQTEISWTKDGQAMTLLLQKSPHRDAKGYIQGIICIGRDITDRKRMERALQDARDVYLTLVEEAPMLVWRTNREGGCDFVNKQWAEFTGSQIEQAWGDGWLDFIHALDRSAFRDVYTAAWREQRAFETEFRLCNRDEVPHWMVTRGTPFFDESGEFAGYIGTCTDITERKRQEQIKDDFLALASHELKTPLAALIGYIHLLKRWSAKQQVDQRIEQALAAMSGESEQLDRLINDLLDVSRIQTGRLHMYFRPLDLTALLQQIVASIQIVFPEHIFDLELPAEQPVIVQADTQRLEQVITNLCTNAAKYSLPRSHVTVLLQATDQEVEICVRDCGLGIPPADLPYIFERFYQVQRPIRESRPGLGLGLFITYEIVRLHGGTILVDSVEHHGSTFTVRLPIEHKTSEEFSADADPTVHPAA